MLHIPPLPLSFCLDTEVNRSSRQGGGGHMRQLVTCVKKLYRDKKQLKAKVMPAAATAVVDTILVPLLRWRSCREDCGR